MRLPLEGETGQRRKDASFGIDTPWRWTGSDCGMAERADAEEGMETDATGKLGAGRERRSKLLVTKSPTSRRLERTQQPERRGRNRAGRGRWQAMGAGERRPLAARTGAVPTKGPPQGRHGPPRETTITTQIGRNQHRCSEEASPETRSSLQQGRARSPARLAAPRKAVLAPSATAWREHAAEGGGGQGRSRPSQCSHAGRKDAAARGRGWGRNLARSDPGWPGRGRAGGVTGAPPPRIWQGGDARRRRRRGRQSGRGWRWWMCSRPDRGLGEGGALARRGTKPPRRHHPWARHGFSGRPSGGGAAGSRGGEETLAAARDSPVSPGAGDAGDGRSPLLFWAPLACSLCAQIATEMYEEIGRAHV